MGIGKDSANDVGAGGGGDGADAIANINNVCFVGGRAATVAGAVDSFSRPRKWAKNATSERWKRTNMVLFTT